MILNPNEQIIGKYNDVTVDFQQQQPILHSSGNDTNYENQNRTGTLVLTNKRVFFCFEEKTVLGFVIHNLYKLSANLEDVTVLVQMQMFTPHKIRLMIDQKQAIGFVQHVNALLGPELLQSSAHLCRFLLESKQFDELFQNEHFHDSVSLQKFESTIYTLYQNQLSVQQNYPKSKGYSLYDPIREFRRMGVVVETPTVDKLAELVFGDEIHPDLLKFLLQNKPLYKKELYYEESLKLCSLFFTRLNLFQSSLTENVQQQFFNASQSYFYDPRSLFTSDEQFYALLEHHPQTQLQNFGLQEFGHHGDDGRELLERDELLDEEVVAESENAEKDKGSGFFNKLFKKKENPENAEKEPKKSKVTANIDFSNEFYAHGSCFKPTYMRVNQIMRQYLIKLINNQELLLYNDFVYQTEQQAKFTMSWLNANYEHSPTYPSLLVFPTSVSEENIQKSMKFRSRGRTAALSWVAPRTGISITRCSQPGRGFGLARDQGDEALLQGISQSGKNVPQQFLIVFDARPKLSAVGNILMGKGYESSKAYPFARTCYCNIENIHAVRDSYEAMIKVIVQYKQQEQRFQSNVNQANDNKTLDQLTQNKLELWTNLQQTKWYTHLQTILTSVNNIAQTVTKLKIHAMVHCSDGWDRTSQLSGLAMLLLDPYYRTIKGFTILIEKEWLGFGHMFATRNRLLGATKVSKRKDNEYQKPVQNGPIINAVQDQCTDYSQFYIRTNNNQQPPKQQKYRFSNSQTSQVFFQFIECVYQYLIQFPTQFEFNTQFLKFIVSELYNNSQGPFMYDNEQQRTQFLVQLTTLSCFDVICDYEQVQQFLNRNYHLNAPLNILRNEVGETCLQCKCQLSDLKIFQEYWLGDLL